MSLIDNNWSELPNTHSQSENSRISVISHRKIFNLFNASYLFWDFHQLSSRWKLRYFSYYFNHSLFCIVHDIEKEETCLLTHIWAKFAKVKFVRKVSISMCSNADIPLKTNITVVASSDSLDIFSNYGKSHEFQLWNHFIIALYAKSFHQSF